MFFTITPSCVALASPPAIIGVCLTILLLVMYFSKISIFYIVASASPLFQTLDDLMFVCFYQWNDEDKQVFVIRNS